MSVDPMRDLESARAVGRKGLPTTLGGLLVHVADHTQRHVGQAISACKWAAKGAGGQGPGVGERPNAAR